MKAVINALAHTPPVLRGGLLLGLALAMLMLPADLTPKAMAGTQCIVISQIYTRGGVTGEPYRHDFIELLNRCNKNYTINGWSVQFAQAGSSSWSVTNISGTIAPGHYYLIREGNGGGGAGAPLPTPDATGNINLSPNRGKVALVSSQTALSVVCPFGNLDVADLVGYGNAGCNEGGSNAPSPPDTKAVIRKGAGCTDGDNNGADFVTDTPTPRNSSSTPVSVPCGSPTAADLASFTATFKRGAVHLEWQTASELDLVGFNVWRKSGTHAWQQLNSDLIPAQSPGVIESHTYRFSDAAVKSGRTYKYKLQLVNADASSDWSAVVKIRIPK